jgi:Spherulation-specific family 4
MEHRAKILVPLYIYPLSDETWWTLYQAYVIPNLLKAGEVANLCSRHSIHSHPSTDFLVVVNPNSGPGGFPLPSHDYIREVPRLNNYKNVTIVGYVLIDYCRRPLSDVFKDIDTYAGWATNQEYLGLGLGGIFLDETPNHFSEQRAEFLATTNQHIKAAAGFSGDKLVSFQADPKPGKEAHGFPIDSLGTDNWTYYVDHSQSWHSP